MVLLKNRPDLPMHTVRREYDKRWKGVNLYAGQGFFAYVRSGICSCFDQPVVVCPCLG